LTIAMLAMVVASYGRTVAPLIFLSTEIFSPAITFRTRPRDIDRRRARRRVRATHSPFSSPTSATTSSLRTARASGYGRFSGSAPPKDINRLREDGPDGQNLDFKRQSGEWRFDNCPCLPATVFRNPLLHSWFAPRHDTCVFGRIVQNVGRIDQQSLHSAALSMCI